MIITDLTILNDTMYKVVKLDFSKKKTIHDKYNKKPYFYHDSLK